MELEKLEEDFTLELLEDNDKLPDFLKGKVAEGEMVIKSESLNTDFLPPKWLKVLAEDSINQRVLWRHKDPENPKHRGIPYGRKLWAGVREEGGKHKMESYYRLFCGPDGSPYKALHDNIKKSVEAKEPIGVSMGFILNKNENGDIVRIFSLEDSITYKPQCKTCLTSEVIQMEGKEEIPTLKEEIAKLRKLLDGSKLQLEQKDAAFVKLETKVNKYESLIESSKTEKLSLEDRIIDLSDSIKKFEAQFIYLEKKPYLEQLEELEDAEIFEMEKGKDVEWLKARLEKVKKEKDGPQVQTKTLEDEKEELEDTGNGEKDVPLVKAFRNNPKLAREIATMKEENSKLELEEGGWY